MPLRLIFEKTTRKRYFNWRGYLVGLGLVVVATVLAYLVHTYFTPANIIMVYPLCVTISAIVGGLGPSILVSVLSVLAFDFFFVTPYYTFAVDDTQYVFTFIVLLLVGITISYLTSRIREQTEAARQRERETAALYALGRDLAISSDMESYVDVIVKRINEALGVEVSLYLPEASRKGILSIYPKGNGPVNNEATKAAAELSFKRREKVLSDLNTQFLPLITARGSVGVISVTIEPNNKPMTEEQERLLEAYVDLVAVAIEGIQLAQELQNAKVLKATERLQSALLNAISHDLRTPLVSIIGTLSSLQEEQMDLDDTAKKNLLQVASEEADRLNHLITNLLDESRIEAGAIKLTKQPAEVQDLVGTALDQLGSVINSRNIKIDIPPDMPFIPVDFGLIVQTLVNILDNALKYSPADSPVEIEAQLYSSEVLIQVTDHGVGIPEQDLDNVFDKFYRIKRPDNVAGTGLGLSIAKGIVEAHGGKIVAGKGLDNGTIITLRLPTGDTSMAESQNS